MQTRFLFFKSIGICICLVLDVDLYQDLKLMMDHYLALSLATDLDLDVYPCIQLDLNSSFAITVTLALPKKVTMRHGP